MLLFKTSELVNSKPLMSDESRGEPTNWRTVVAELTARFEAHSVGSPAVSARRIAAEASGLSGVELELSLDSAPTERMMQRLDAMAARRVNHEPLQYVVGSWGFGTLDVVVDKRVLIPRPETEELAGWAIAEIDRLGTLPAFTGGPIHVVDLGTGSGVIGLSVVAERDNTEVTLTDSDTDALDIARANCAGLGCRAARVVGIKEGSWFEALPSSLKGEVGLIVSNPPYVAEQDELPREVIDWEPSHALYAADDGLANVYHLIDNSPAWLHPQGVIVIEMAPAQVALAAERAGKLFADVEQLTDQFGRKRAIRAALNGTFA